MATLYFCARLATNLAPRTFRPAGSRLICRRAKRLCNRRRAGPVSSLRACAASYGITSSRKLASHRCQHHSIRIEFFADKIPAFDLLWSALHTFIRVPVAALLAYGATRQLRPCQQLLAAFLGGLIALAAHGGKTALRAAVTPSPEPFSNISLSLSEDVLAVGLTWLATRHPYAAASIAIVLLVSHYLVGPIGHEGSASSLPWRRTRIGCGVQRSPTLCKRCRMQESDLGPIWNFRVIIVIRTGIANGSLGHPSDKAPMSIFDEKYRVVGVEHDRLMVRGVQTGEVLTIINPEP